LKRLELLQDLVDLFASYPHDRRFNLFAHICFAVFVIRIYSMKSDYHHPDISLVAILFFLKKWKKFKVIQIRQVNQLHYGSNNYYCLLRDEFLED
jgi:hypothetical protein